MNEAYHENEVETWANDKTISLTIKEQQKLRQTKVVVAKNSFIASQGKIFNFADEKVEVYYPGHAHSPDNVLSIFTIKKFSLVDV